MNRATALPTTTPSAFQEEFAAERLRQLKSRFHLLLYVSMVTSAAFAVSDAAVLPPNVGSLQSIKALNIAACVICLLALRRCDSFWSVIALAESSLVVICAVNASSGVIRGDLMTTSIITVGGIWVMAVVLPWGVLPQLIAAVIGSASIFAGYYVVHGALVPEAVYQPVRLMNALVISLFPAFEFERQRRRHGAAMIALQEGEARLRAAKDAADAASAAKSEFLATMSHEIRTPLNVIMGMTEMLLDSPLRPDQRDNVVTIDNWSRHLIEIIGDLLDLSRIEAKGLDLESEPFSLRQSLARTCRGLEVGARRKGLGLQWSVDPEVPDAIVGDMRRLQQVIVNLVGNAIKYTADGGVRLRVDVVGANGVDAELHFAVHDTGPGIPKARRQDIFDSFTQLRSHGTGLDGAGLGLAISKQLVTLMNGRLWVESDEGRGSTFHFTVNVGRT